MSFQSILYAPGTELEETPVRPPFFADLHLDQIVSTIVGEREEYGLEPLFYTVLPTLDAIRYRQEIMKALERDLLLETVRSFASSMRLMRAQLANAQRLRDRFQQERWFLHAAQTYCAAVVEFRRELERAQPSALGLVGLRDYVGDYATGDAFRSLAGESASVAAELSEVRYTVLLREATIRVGRFNGETDYGKELEATFERFWGGEVKSYYVTLPAHVEMDQVEAKILTLVAELFPEQFAHLSQFAARHAGFVDPAVARFDREVQFYVSYIEFMRRLTSCGLSFTYPDVGEERRTLDIRDAFDASLALRLCELGETVVRNDVVLEDDERAILVSGPNQGGKTTLLRAVGQTFHLAALGCPVPARQAQLDLCDAVFTHFEREESADVMRGKLEDDIVRIHDILTHATSRSVLIVNEMFSSTSVRDALDLGGLVMQQILERDILCMWVSFLYELASLSPKIASMESVVNPADLDVRTFKIVRRAPEGRAYAMSIAEKYGLTHDAIRRRFGATGS